MYKSFRVKNFRCFKDLQINDLGQVNLIAGKNNTGKTALMEAIVVLTSPLSPQLLYGLHEARDIKNSKEYRRECWKQFFYEFDTAVTIQMEGHGNDSTPFHRALDITEVPNDVDSVSHFGKYYNVAKDLGLIGEGSLNIQGTSLLRLSFSQPGNGGEETDVYLPSNPSMPEYSNVAWEQKSQFIPAQNRPPIQWVAEQFSNIDLSGDLPQLVGSLAIFESRLTDLRLHVLSGDLAISGRVDSFQIPLKLMGEGVNRFCYFAITMYSKRPQYLCIDEIENGIHHSVQKDVWKAIGRVARDLDIQVFATTHSLEMVHAAREAFSEDSKLDEFRYHRLDRDREGNIEAVTYSDSGIESAMATNWEIRG